MGFRTARLSSLLRVDTATAKEPDVLPHQPHLDLTEVQLVRKGECVSRHDHAVLVQEQQVAVQAVPRGSGPGPTGGGFHRHGLD